MINMKDYQLTPITEQDLNTVFEWRHTERIKSSMYTDHQITWEEHCDWFKRIKEAANKQVLLLHHNQRPLGLVNFTNMDRKNGRCYWGFYIGEKDAPKGSGTMMGIMALDHMFQEEGIQKICSEVIHTNKKSIHFHEKLGFVTEGRFINHLWKDHQYFDVIPMALFQKKWKKMRGKYLDGLKEGEHE